MRHDFGWHKPTQDELKTVRFSKDVEEAYLTTYEDLQLTVYSLWNGGETIWHYAVLTSEGKSGICSTRRDAEACAISAAYLSIHGPNARTNHS